MLNDAAMEHVVPVLAEVAFEESRETFELLLVWERIVNDFFLQEQFDRVSEDVYRVECK